MSWLSDYADFLDAYWAPFHVISPLLGYDQYKATTASNHAQIDYSEYMKGGNDRALSDWYKNVGSQGKSIKYPELSYSGAIRGYDTGITRANLSNYSADANLYRNFVYGSAGLYGISGRIARSL